MPDRDIAQYRDTKSRLGPLFTTLIDTLLFDTWPGVAYWSTCRFWTFDPIATPDIFWARRSTATRDNIKRYNIALSAPAVAAWVADLWMIAGRASPWHGAWWISRAFRPVIDTNRMIGMVAAFAGPEISWVRSDDVSANGAVVSVSQFSNAWLE